MKRQKWVVRVVNSDPEKFGLERELGWPAQVPGDFLDCLRAAGLITVHEASPERQVFDIHCPAGPHQVDTQLWAEMNADRMKSFGYNAVAAPAAQG